MNPNILDHLKSDERPPAKACLTPNLASLPELTQLLLIRRSRTFKNYFWSRKFLSLLRESFFARRKFLHSTCAKVRCGLKCRKALQQTGIVGWFGWSSGSCQSPAENVSEGWIPLHGSSGFRDNLIDVEDCWGIKILLRSLHWCRHPKDLFLQRPISGK